MFLLRVVMVCTIGCMISEGTGDVCVLRETALGNPDIAMTESGRCVPCLADEEDPLPVLVVFNAPD